jgi:DNA-directed RNA polymerase specialized sigma24 family protein
LSFAAQQQPEQGNAMSEPAIVVAEIEQRAIDGRQLRVMLAAAAYHARRIARTMRLGDAEREDVEQDIVVALLERRRFFDPSRGAWSSFADRVARQAAQGLADAIGAERRLSAGSLDGPDDGETKALRNAVELKMISASDSDVALSVAQFVDGLPKDLAHVARIVLLEEGEFAEAQRRSGLGNGEFFRKLREIRVQLVLSQIVRKRLSPDDTPGWN